MKYRSHMAPWELPIRFKYRSRMAPRGRGGRAGPGRAVAPGTRPSVVLFLVPSGGPYEAVFVYNMGLQKDPLSGLPFRKGFAGGPPAGVLLREAKNNKKH